MWLNALRERVRRVVGAVMTMLGGFALLSGTLAWRRGTHMAVLGTIYLLAGVILALQGIQFFRTRNTK
jgi:hypothetical protein